MKPAFLTVALLTACSSEMTDQQYETAVVTGMHDALLVDLDDLVQAAKEMQAAAPTGHAWSATGDAAAIQATKAAWIRARTAYEHIEGALAPIFPDIDESIDFRYDDFLAKYHGDDDLFDDQKVTGLHAAERILWADQIPAHVVAFEQTLTGYKAAAFPASAAEAAELHDKLLAKIITDATTLRDQWTPQHIDLPGAYAGLIDLMNEQREKVNKASSSEEESRYSQRTMADLRDNLDGTTAIYLLFKPWLQSKSGGSAVDASIEAGFANLHALYAMTSGDAIPTPPSTWSAESPSAADLATPFGKLYTGVNASVDPDTDGSVVFEMNKSAKLLGLAGTP